mgnify:CR=1 FL=1
MTHTASHIIISGRKGLTAPITFSESATPGSLKVWHVALALVLVGFLVGLAF